MCSVWISEQTAIISLYNINWLVCITERSVFTARYGLHTSLYNNNRKTDWISVTSNRLQLTEYFGHRKEPLSYKSVEHSLHSWAPASFSTEVTYSCAFLCTADAVCDVSTGIWSVIQRNCFAFQRTWYVYMSAWTGLSIASEQESFSSNKGSTLLRCASYLCLLLQTSYM